MAGNVLHVLLWLFSFAIVGMVFRRALGLFHNAETTMEDWVSLSIGAIFLVGTAVLVYAFGAAGIPHVTALLP